MTLAITPLYAAVAGLLFIGLSARVIRLRRRENIAIGDDGNLQLRRAVRVQANFAEYAPLALLLCAFVELGGYPRGIIHGLGLSLLAGRAIHAYGVSQVKENYALRVLGMSLTFLATGGASLLLLIGALFGDGGNY